MAALEDLVVITGFSGAGKSTAMAVFEDAGWFCVDNLPPEMIRSLVDLFMHEGSKVERAAIVSDVRSGESFEELAEIVASLVDHPGLTTRIVFLDADEQSLVDRYKETRRRHPLAGQVRKGIAAERELLAPLKAVADAVIDTTGLKGHDLRRRVATDLLPRQQTLRLAITFQSFGFKNGPARDADLLFDVRFLPNPHYVPDLKPLTGRDPRVVDYVGQDGTLDRFYTHLEGLLDFLVPQYQQEGKSHLMVCIGCTGGRHRSVAIAEHLGRRYGAREDLFVEVVHRDADRAR